MEIEVVQKKKDRMVLIGGVGVCGLGSSNVGF